MILQNRKIICFEVQKKYSKFIKLYNEYPIIFQFHISYLLFIFTHNYLYPVRKKQNKIIVENLLIEDYAAEGKCIGKWNGKVVFVENCVPEDVVNVQLIKNKKDWAEAFPISFIEYSRHRTTPFCTHFGVCGGCKWQMLPYEKQLYFKAQQVNDNLSRIGKIALPEIMPIVGCEKNTHYRNKLEYTFANKRFIAGDEFKNLKKDGVDVNEASNKNVAGFHAKGVFDKVVEIDECFLQHEPTNSIRNSIANFANQNNLSFYDIWKHEGWLRNIMVRLSTTGELMLNIILGYEDKTSMENLFQHILKNFPQVTTLLYTINPKQNDSIYDLEPKTYFGKGYITEKLNNYVFKIGPKSFFQTNTKQAEKLYQITKDFADLDGSQIVYDLYCGTGSIGIFVSEGAKKVIGVETIVEAVEDAKENAAFNKIHHASFFAGDVIKICTDEFFAIHGKPDVIITDPPRAGMHTKLIEKLLQIEAQLIVYVSCNPATQARDLNLLSEKYNVEKVQPVDMFPHTHHIENVVQLKLIK